MSFAHQHPLFGIAAFSSCALNVRCRSWQLTDVQLVPVIMSVETHIATLACLKHVPFIVDRLDDESQCRTDCIDILIHNLLDDCRFPRVVESTAAG